MHLDLKKQNQELSILSALEILEWGVKEFEDHFAITTSFGIQSSVLLHILSQIKNYQSIKVFWIDTGYLPAETYQYAEELINTLSINIKVIQSEISPARMEALFGKLWETKSKEDLEKYHLMRKINPLDNALTSYGVECWASGVRSEQTLQRKDMNYIEKIRTRYSLRPILKWTKKEIYYYMEKHNLPQHPLFEKGYSTVGDWHSSSANTETSTDRDTRFNGVSQECGIHL
tara:strand:+ start:9122 stop:9814 length:693 start_codon:yes stop_codon:yes gene_type:complete